MMNNKPFDADTKPYSPYDDPDVFSDNSDMDEEYEEFDLDFYCYTVPSDPSADRPANMRHIMTADPTD